MANFDHVAVALDADGHTIDLSGQATTEVSQDVEITTVVKAVADGSTQTYTTAGTAQTEQPGETVIESASDTLGRTYTVSADGQHASF